MSFREEFVGRGHLGREGGGEGGRGGGRGRWTRRRRSSRGRIRQETFHHRFLPLSRPQKVQRFEGAAVPFYFGPADGFPEHVTELETQDLLF